MSQSYSLAEEDKSVIVTDAKNDIKLHKIVIRKASNPLFTDRSLNILRVVLAANLKINLSKNNLLPANYKQEFEMEVIHDLLLRVERWLKAKREKLGPAKFKLWTRKTLIKFEALKLLQDPESVRCAEIL